jgi:hypothetical protein
LEIALGYPLVYTPGMLPGARGGIISPSGVLREPDSAALGSFDSFGTSSIPGWFMPKVATDADRENRIATEIVVDAYGEEERAMGWYYYLEDQLQFPFQARCVTERKTSPLAVGDRVKVVGLAPAEECLQEVFVTIQRSGKKLAVPLAQLEAVGVDPDTQEGIDDWHYWVNRGYQY